MTDPPAASGLNRPAMEYRPRSPRDETGGPVFPSGILFVCCARAAGSFEDMKVARSK
jgi:hypothetical protein